MKIAQYKGHSWQSKLIKFITRSDYSHSAFLFDEQTQKAAEVLRREGCGLARIPFTSPGSIVEAWMPVMRNVGSFYVQHEPGTPVDVFELKNPLTIDEEKALLLWLCPEIGTPYNLRDVFRFVTRRPGNLDNSWFCSEILYCGLQHVNRALFERTEGWRVPPDWIPRSPLLNYVETLTT